MTLKISIGNKEMDLTQRVGAVFMQGYHDVENLIRALHQPSKLMEVLYDKSAPHRIKSELVGNCQRNYDYTPEEKEIYEAGVNRNLDLLFSESLGIP